MKNATKAKALYRENIEAVLKVWENMAGRLEGDANKQDNPNIKEALLFAAAIYRTCMIDLTAATKGILPPTTATLNGCGDLS